MNYLLIAFFLSIVTPVISFADSNVELDDRKFYLHVGHDELGNFRWGNFLSCLKTVKFPNDPGPRELYVNIPRLIITNIDDHEWIISVREEDKDVTLESITIGTHKYYTLKEKRRLFLRIVGNCNTKEFTD